MNASRTTEGRLVELVDHLLTLILEVTHNGRDSIHIVHNSLVQALQTQSRTSAKTSFDSTPILRKRSLEKLNFFRAIARLPREVRPAMILSYIEGFSYEQIATLVGLNTQIVKSVLERGRKLIRHELYEYLLSYGVAGKAREGAYLVPDEFEATANFS